MGEGSYFMLNKAEDFVRQKGCLCSDLLDSGERKTRWSRLAVNYGTKNNTDVRIALFVSEAETIVWKNKRYPVRELILNKDIGEEEKKSLFCACEIFCPDRGKDFLLHHITGRYICVLVFGKAVETALEEELKIQIFFQWNSWLDYLPEPYRQRRGTDDFLFRYLSIFQWIYHDMSDKISSVPHMFYPVHADRKLLEWMASWFGMENVTVWNKEQLVYLIENGTRLSGMRGTRQYMEEMISLYTGCIPFIVEYYQTDKDKTEIKKTRLIEKLYGENAYVVTVILPQGAVTDQKEIAVLKKIIRSASPAYMECRLVVLEPYIFLDRYSYTGINSCLGGYRDICLDDNRLTPYISVVTSQNAVKDSGHQI